MELYIFNRNLEFVGILEGYTSLVWTRRYNKCGEFELHCALTTESLELLQRENIIYKKGDSEAGVVSYRSLAQNIEGKEILVVTGKFLTSYLSRRIVWGTEILKTTTEVAMRSLVANNSITVTDTSRIIENLMLNTLKNYTGNVNYQTSYKNLADEIEILSTLSDLGYRINLDVTNKKLVFEIYKGLDRSINQSINPVAIFSKEFENILEMEYIDSLNNYKNLCLIGGMGEGTSRKLVTIGNSVGLDRFEIFNDQKDLSNEVDSVIMSDADYNLLLTEKGNETLTENTDIKTFDSKVNTNSNLDYKINYDLGDIVTCISKKWGLIISTRIIEIQEVYEESGKQINITFGTNIPTLIDKIKSLRK